MRGNGRERMRNASQGKIRVQSIYILSFSFFLSSSLFYVISLPFCVIPCDLYPSSASVLPPFPVLFCHFCFILIPSVSSSFLSCSRSSCLAAFHSPCSLSSRLIVISSYFTIIFFVSFPILLILIPSPRFYLHLSYAVPYFLIINQSVSCSIYFNHHSFCLTLIAFCPILSLSPGGACHPENP